MLCVADVAFAYDVGRPVLREISFAAAPGDVVAIVGRNGAGKSTLLRLLNGLLRPQRGSITVAGAATSTTPVHVLARTIGTVFQAPEQQMFHATVRDEIAFGARQLGATGDTLRARVDDTLERVGLTWAAAVHPLDLDHAARRFVALGSVLIMQPPILLLDEPQRGLDRGALTRLETIVAERAAAGAAVLVVCHDMEFVARRATRVVALADGRVVADVPTPVFFADGALTRTAGVEAPDTVALTRALGEPLALTPSALAAELMKRV